MKCSHRTINYECNGISSWRSEVTSSIYLYNALFCSTQLHGWFITVHNTFKLCAFCAFFKSFLLSFFRDCCCCCVHYHRCIFFLCRFMFVSWYSTVQQITFLFTIERNFARGYCDTTKVILESKFMSFHKLLHVVT